MALLPSAQKDQIKVLVAVAALALAGYYYMYPYATRAEDLATRETNVETLETANTKARLQSRPGRAKQLAAEAARLGASLDAMQRLVPTVHEVPALLDEVSTAARRAGLEIGGVAPEPVIRGAEFDTYRYRVTVVGGYHPLASFLANVGSLPRIVAPVGFALAPSRLAGTRNPMPRPTVAQQLEATVTIQTYVAHTPADPDAGQAAASAGEPVADPLSEDRR